MEIDEPLANQRVKVLGAMLEQLKHPEDAASAVAMSYLASRASVTGNDFAAVMNWMYPDNAQLMDFEQERFNNLMTLGNASAWNGIIERIWSEATILDCTATRSEAKLTIRDWTKIQWHPAPVPIRRTIEQEELVRQSPEKYGLDTSDFPFVHSGFATHHEISMVRTSRGWLVLHDEYEDPILTLRRISGVQSSLASIFYLKAGKTSIESPAIRTPDPEQEPTKSKFDWSAAANYGARYAQAGNPVYREFLPNDCANFTSQCLTAGGLLTDDTWSPYTNAWIDSGELRNWLIATGRGVPTDEGALGLGDIINYRSNSNRIHEGSAIVTGLPGPLISCHSSGHLNVPYKAIASPRTSFLYTTLLDRY